MPTPNMYLHTDINPFAEVPPALQTSDIDVLFVTDRAETKDKNGKPDFGYGRSRSLAFGSYIVGVGNNVSWADLVADSRTKSRKNALPLWRKEIRVIGRLDETPTPMIMIDGVPSEDPAVRQRSEQARDVFCAEVSRRLALTPSKKEVAVYIHGFNNSMDDAAFTIGEMWHFGGRKGVPIAYTWPAGKSYPADYESCQFTIFHLKQFLRGIASCPDVEKIHLIAHSRGTDVTTTALRELNIEYKSAGKSTRDALKLGNLVLCAADLDLDVVGQRLGAERLQFVPERVTLYVSQTDRALGAASKFIFKGGDRLGHMTAADLSPQQRKSLAMFPQLQIIDANIKSDLIGHAYFHTNPAVSSDLLLVLRDNAGPGAENGRPMIRRDDGFWEIRDDYLLSDAK
ncbi:MAG TPA: alpha/beta hydrolase [Phycisphaerae bacterium]|nr:alpha/beta hydrolase [Phycisphaerae bacterium]